MDPLTHALLGASASHALLAPRLKRRAWLAGALGGLLPDIDILIQSSSDPLLAIEYHRHFTHALAFIPFGGAVAALPWLLRKANRADWQPLYVAACIGYATHGVLDACTNYGTHLLWPFSESRSAWNLMTTVGPLLTLCLLIGLVFAVRCNTRRPAAVGLLLAGLYAGIAMFQHERALTAQQEIAATRQHEIERSAMFPTVGNPFVWRSMYESGGRYYTDRLRVMGDIRWQPGSSIAVFRSADLPPDVGSDARLRRDFERFSYFSSGWVALSSVDAGVFGDVRYSLRSDRFEPIWGIRLHPGNPSRTEWVDRTINNRIPASLLWNEILGRTEGYRLLGR